MKNTKRYETLNVEDLDNVLDSLASDESRISFLKQIYSPGNTAIADRIFSLQKGSLSESYENILESELKYAGKESPNGKRFQEIAKKYLDSYFENHHPSLAISHLDKWNNEDLNNYAMQKMQNVVEDKESPEHIKSDHLKALSELAESLGNQELRMNSLEKLLTLQKKNGSPSVDGTLKKLKRYGEALDNYLANKSYHNAFSLAKEKVPGKSKEIAEEIYSNIECGKGDVSLFLDCAEELGKIPEATKKVVEYSKDMKIEGDRPHSYYQLVQGLVKLNEIKMAEEIVEEVGKSVKENSRREYEQSEDLAKLYDLIGDKDSIKEIYREIFENMVYKKFDLRNWDDMLERSRKILGDKKVFGNEEMRIWEKCANYEDAEKVARGIGNEKMVEIYSKMQNLRTMKRK